MRMKVLLTLGMALWGCCLGPASPGQERRGPFVEAPRSVRSRDYDELHLRLELAFDWERQEVRGRAVHTLKLFRPAHSITFDAAGMSVERVEASTQEGAASGATAQFEQHPRQLVVHLESETPAGQTVYVGIDYRIVRPEEGVHFVRPDASEPEKRQMVWTQSQPDSARYWFPCLDSPLERCTTETLVTVPQGMYVLSNGVLKTTKENADQTATWHWAQEQTHSPYLVSVVAGDFECYEQSWRGMPVLSYVPRGRLPDAERSFGKTPAMLEYFSTKIGVDYPWPKYAQICCEEYGGGMEHTSATTLTVGTLHDERAHLDVSSDSLVAHELAHQWWGDMLTCKDWGEVWLNESFATYFATLWAEHDRGWEEATWERFREATGYQAEDAGSYRRPIVSYRYRSSIDMFDGHSYPKGARVLHMLRYVLGDDAFWASLKHYAEKNKFQPVETADLREAIEETTGLGLNWFFDQWVYHGGHPEFAVSHRWDEAGKQVAVTVAQRQSVTDLTPLFRMPVEIDFVLPEGTVRKKVEVTKAEETFHFELPARPTRVVFDPDDWILKTLTCEKSTQEWLDQLAKDAHVMPRYYAVKGLADQISQPEVQAAFLTALSQDAFWAVRQEIARALANAAGDDMKAALLKAAQADSSSSVRRAAVAGLARFPNEDTAQALRTIIASDASYGVVAEALTSLAAVDGEKAVPDLLAALEQNSHQQGILRAASEGLVQLKPKEIQPKLVEMIQGPTSGARKAAVLSALGRLGKNDPEVVTLIMSQLTDKRTNVQRAATEALALTGDSQLVPKLAEYRDRNANTRFARWLQTTMDALSAPSDSARVAREVDRLRDENRRLEERLQALERTDAP